MPTLGVLPPETCWRRLCDAYTVMLSFAFEDDVHAMPVNVCVRGSQVWLRARDGVKLRAARAGVRMAVAVHDQDPLTHGGWSVTARGVAGVDEAGPPRTDQPVVRPWAADAREGTWVRIDVDRITGRALGPATS